MGSSSSCAVLMLVLFAGQLLIANPAAAKCSATGPQDNPDCVGCLAICRSDCLPKAMDLQVACTEGCAVFCSNDCVGICGKNCLIKTPELGEAGCTQGCLAFCPKA